MIVGISKAQEKIISEILKPYLDEFAFFYYGSRVKGGFEATSDLDILIKGKEKMPREALEKIKEKFDQSLLPFIVNLSDYFSVDQKFHEGIKGDLERVSGDAGISGMEKVFYEKDKIVKSVAWDIKPISSLCVLAIDCVNKTAPVVGYKTPYKMLRTTNVKSGFIDFETVRYVEKDVFEKWTRRSKPRFGDVIFTREAPVGEVGRFTSKEENFFLGQRLFHYRPDPKLLDWNYLAYVLQGSLIQGWVNGIAFGATVSHIKVEDAENLEIPVPTLAIQKKIGGILSAYDDLIENNNRRIKILEEIAQKLYKEWFVDFKFPNHQNTKFIDSSLGKIPEGWEVGLLSDLVEFKNGYPFKSQDYLGGGKYKIVTIKNVQDGWFIPDTTDAIQQLPNKLKDYHKLSTGDILMSLTGNVGRVCLVYGDDFLLNQRVAKIVTHKSDDIGFIYTFLRNRETLKILEKISNGAAQQNLSPVNASQMKLLIPNRVWLSEFSKKINHSIKLVCNLNKQNQTLRQTRDLLLPRLISGELSVENLEVKI
ncbi:MAG: restriction endonuclease subunit S [Rickettsiales bacterium]|nr:restriction endonuclease subunit S [Rickettsiales bacterium]